MKTLLLILVFIGNNVLSYSQHVELNEIISSVAEELADDEADTEAVAAYADQLYDLTEKPVKINAASLTELSRLFFLNDFQIKALADYVQTTGKIVSAYEIANIPGFDREHAEMIIPFITLESTEKQLSDPIHLQNSLLTNFSTRFTGRDTTQIGSPWKMLTRYKFTIGKISGGITAEKDAGEKLLCGKFPRPDFLSANLAWNGDGILKRVIIGDYGGRFGLGTNINTGLSSGISLTASGYLSGADEIKSYTSTNENNFFRGAAAMLKFRNTGLSVFFSVNHIDATIGASDIPQQAKIETFYRSGLHNTPSLMRKKDSVIETSYGINISHNFKSTRIGLLYSGTGFSLPVYPDTINPERAFSFSGRKNDILSASYKAAYHRMIFFGEISYTLRKKAAIVQGISFRPADRLNFNILYRYYEPGFASFHGKGAFSSSSGDNLKGLFGNFTFEAGKHFFIIGGCDLKYNPWLKYRCSAPSSGKSRELRFKYFPSEKITIDVLLGSRSSNVDIPGNGGIAKQSETVSRAVSGRVRYALNGQLSFGTRCDYKIAEPYGTSGMLLLQDINYKSERIPLKFWFRYCIFRTGDWNSRLFAYENDLSSSFNVPALSGTGNRSYLMVEWSFRRIADLRIKYLYSDMINGQSIPESFRELKLQLKLWF